MIIKIISMVLPCLIYSLNCQNFIHDSFLNNSHQTFQDHFNYVLDYQNPSSISPPKTDLLTLDMNPFKYPFSFASKMNHPGGWQKILKDRDLPIAKNFILAFEELERGSIRELHWHNSDEWIYVIQGIVRITAVDPKGKAFVGDVGAGDFWYFPRGVAHGFQQIGRNGGILFGLRFGSSVDTTDTFNLNSWMTGTPLEVLTKNFQVPKITFADLKPTKVILNGRLPRQLDEEIKEVMMGTIPVPNSFAFYSSKMKPNVTRKGGTIKIIDKNNFPVTDLAAIIMILYPGAMQELHWHPNADEVIYVISGCARITLFSGSKARTMDFQTGDIGIIPKSFGHYIENTGNTNLFIISVFNAPYFQDLTLAQWLAHTPTLIVNQHIRTGIEFIKSIPKQKLFILP